MKKISKEDYQALLARRDALLVELNTLDVKYEEIKNEYNNEKIANKKIVKALTQQSFYFFVNKPNVVFETTTGLFWPNMDTFPYNGGSDSSGGCYCRDNVRMPTTIDGLCGWRFPRVEEIYNFARNSKNPFREGYCNNLKFCWAFWLEGNNYPYIFLNFTGLCRNTTNSSGAVFFLPCTSAMTDNTRFAVLTAGDEKLLSPKQRAQLLLEFFLENGLVPAFDDKTVTPLFEKFYLERHALLDMLGKVEAAIAATKVKLDQVEAEIAAAKEKVELTVNFDHRPLLEDYDLKAIAHSPLQYYTAVGQWVDLLLEKLAGYEVAQASKVYHFQRLQLCLAKVQDSWRRGSFLRNEIGSGVEAVKQQLLTLKEENKRQQKRLGISPVGINVMGALQEVAEAQRVDFALLAEATAAWVKQAIYQTEYYALHTDLVDELVAIWLSWEQSACNYREQQKALLEELCSQSLSKAASVKKTATTWNAQQECEADKQHSSLNGAGQIDPKWLKIKYVDEWEKVRNMAEFKLQPLMEQALAGGWESEVANNLVLELMEALTDFRRDVDRFYLEERIDLHQRYTDSKNGEIKETVELALGLLGMAESLHTALEKVIFDCTRVEDRYFIQSWAEELLILAPKRMLQLLEKHEVKQEKLVDDLRLMLLPSWNMSLQNKVSYQETREGWYKAMGRLFLDLRDALVEEQEE